MGVCTGVLVVAEPGRRLELAFPPGDGEENGALAEVVGADSGTGVALFELTIPDDAAGRAVAGAGMLPLAVSDARKEDRKGFFTGSIHVNSISVKMQ